MRAIVKQRPAPGADFVADHPDAPLPEEWVRIAVGATSVCGTDRELWEYSDSARAFPVRFPVVLGHETAGTVVEVGSAVRTLAVGDRVAIETHIADFSCPECRAGDPHLCRNMGLFGVNVDGAFAERTMVPASTCVRLPESVSFEAGAMLESAGVGMHAVQRAGAPFPGANVLISGGGPIGLVIAELSLIGGAAKVVVIEPNPYRRALIEQRGAIAVAPGPEVIEIARLTGERSGFDIGYEVSGVNGTLSVLLEASRLVGTVVTIGHPGQPTPIDVAQHINKRGITLRGVFGRLIWQTWELLIPLVASGRLDLDRLVTHRLPLERVADAIDLLSQDAGKVVIIPDLEVHTA
ncbi:zinc-dependent alcohol dehydrogenase [Compostimonas suwonensis]|uniref:Threonine 3-dehydrogenase n=1 Tax=Compostimonas suwonensis TaxID=1048394 RepID=A0A2M9BBS3_9MICO|nr:alcohol dehydrogenase catalytic domain-containing protein [Compostimonas suwonensis]PJJ55372.1 threonine 3-dehydrogenase [Compostimonas suwonensis]